MSWSGLALTSYKQASLALAVALGSLVGGLGHLPRHQGQEGQEGGQQSSSSRRSFDDLDDFQCRCLGSINTTCRSRNSSRGIDLEDKEFLEFLAQFEDRMTSSLE